MIGNKIKEVRSLYKAFGRDAVNHFTEHLEFPEDDVSSSEEENEAMHKLFSNGWITGPALPSGKIFKILNVKLQYNLGDAHPNPKNAGFPMDEPIKLIEKIPPKIAKSISEANIDVIVGNGSVTDFKQLERLKGVKPRGWPEGSSWDNVAGVDGIPLVAIGTHGLAYKNMVLHEIGHGFDASLATESQISGHQHSHSPVFKELYAELDYTQIHPYFYQGGNAEAGREELFAALFAAALNNLDDTFHDPVTLPIYKPMLDYMHSLLNPRPNFLVGRERK